MNPILFLCLVLLAFRLVFDLHLRTVFRNRADSATSALERTVLDPPRHHSDGRAVWVRVYWSAGRTLHQGRVRHRSSFVRCVGVSPARILCFGF